MRHTAEGDASAASRPPQARARAVAAVCLAAQPPADRSVQRLRRRRRWTSPADRWAARRCSGPPSARQRARTDAAPCLLDPPPQGAHTEGTGAATLCPCHGCLSPPHLRTGALPLAALLEVSSCAAPATGPLRSFLPPCTRSYCNARGLLRQGPASWRAPAGRPPRAGRQRRP
jgi:hypothetical protein